MREFDDSFEDIFEEIQAMMGSIIGSIEEGGQVRTFKNFQMR